MIFLTYIFIALAAACNALMDKVETTISFNTSIFKRLNIAFWCKAISAHNVKFIPFTKYRADAWHLSKSTMIIFWCLAIIFYHTFIPVIDFIVMGIVYNLTFNLFYNYIFKTKTK